MKRLLKMKNLIYLVVFLLILTTISSAQLQLSSPRKGDYWDYDIYTVPKNLTASYRGNVHIEVKESIPLKINGILHSVKKIVKNTTLAVFYNGSKGIKNYIITSYLDSNNSMLRYTDDEITAGKRYTVDYNPPLRYLTLETGKDWYQNTTLKIAESNGNYTDNISTHYICIGKENISTKAGIFNCYILETITNNDYKNRIVRYYSPKVGYGIGFGYIREDRYSNGTLYWQKDLTSFGNIYNKEKKNTPGFTTVVFISSILLVTTYLLVRRRYR